MSPEIQSLLDDLASFEKYTTQGEWRVRERTGSTDSFVERPRTGKEAYGVEVMGEDYPHRRLDAEFITLAKRLAMALNSKPIANSDVFLTYSLTIALINTHNKAAEFETLFGRTPEDYLAEYSFKAPDIYYAVLSDLSIPLPTHISVP